MIFREFRRFFVSSRLLSLTGVFVLAAGVGSSAVAASLLLAFSSLRYPGMRAQGYAAIGEGDPSGIVMPVSWSRFEQLRLAPGSGLRLAAYTPAMEADLAEGPIGRRKIRVVAVSSSFFSGFTLPLAAGRNLTSDESEGSGQRSALLSAELAKTLFGSPAKALRRQIILKGLPFLITGVASPSFHGLFADRADAWVSANCVNPLLMDLGAAQTSSSTWKLLNAFFVLAASDSDLSPRLASELNLTFPRPSALVVLWPPCRESLSTRDAMKNIGAGSGWGWASRWPSRWSVASTYASSCSPEPRFSSRK